MKRLTGTMIAAGVLLLHVPCGFAKQPAAAQQSVSPAAASELAKQFEFWSALDLHQRPEFFERVTTSSPALFPDRESEFRQLLSPGATVTLPLAEGEETLLSLQRFAAHLNSVSFMELVHVTPLSGIKVTIRNGEARAAYTQHLDDSKKPVVAETELTIKPALDKGRLQITGVHIRNRAPAPDEAKKAADLRKAAPYNPLVCLGGRYLGGGTLGGTSPSFSPDGKQIVFSAVRGQGAGKPATMDVYLVNRDGTGERDLTKSVFWNTAPRFSPDGRRVLFLSDEHNPAGEPHSVDLRSGTGGRLLPGIDFATLPVFSPDGSQMAFLVGRQMERRLAVAKPDGSAVRFLTGEATLSEDPVFSPDGEILVYERLEPPESGSARRWNLYAVPVAGGEERRLTDSDARKFPLAFRGPDSFLFVQWNPAGRNEIQIVSLKTGET